MYILDFFKESFQRTLIKKGRKLLKKVVYFRPLPPLSGKVNNFFQRTPSLKKHIKVVWDLRYEIFSSVQVNTCHGTQCKWWKLIKRKRNSHKLLERTHVVRRPCWIQKVLSWALCGALIGIWMQIGIWIQPLLYLYSNSFPLLFFGSRQTGPQPQSVTLKPVWTLCPMCPLCPLFSNCAPRRT